MTDLFSFYRGKRVFVTGHTGFKGGWLCRLLALAGAEVCGYALDPAEPSFFRLCGFTGEDVRGDVRDHPRLSEAVRQGLSLARRTTVFSLPEQPPKRVLLELTAADVPRPREEQLLIETGRSAGDYTEEYRRLTGDFYLKF